MKKSIYLDYSSTTPVDPIVLDVMFSAYKNLYGNSESNTHQFGWSSALALKNARNEVANLINVSAQNIIFNSGATESNNHILRAFAEEYKDIGCHFITSAIEHSSILECLEYLKTRGCLVSYIPVDKLCRLDLDCLESAICKDTRLISIMAANNETGVIQDIGQISSIAKKYGIPFHSDASQLVGKLPLDIQQIPIDYLSISSHKFYGPKGVGALYARDMSILYKHPLFHGGGHERGIRSGSINLPAIVGFSQAAKISTKEKIMHEAIKLRNMKFMLINLIKKEVPSIVVNGELDDTLPGVMNFIIPNVDSKIFLSLTNGKIALSTGSACTSSTQEPSHVLRAMGICDEDIKCSLRLSIGRFTSESDILEICSYIVSAVRKIQGVFT